MKTTRLCSAVAVFAPTLSDGSAEATDKAAPNLSGAKRAETQQTATALRERLMTNQGAPISDNQNQLKAGARGPVRQPLLDQAGVLPDGGVVALGKGADAFLHTAKEPPIWAREPRNPPAGAGCGTTHQLALVHRSPNS